MKKFLKRKIAFAWILIASMIAPMLSYAITSEAAATSTTVADDKNFDAMSISEIMDLNDSVTWVFAGDSITHNAGWAMGMNGYAEWFEQFLYKMPKRQNDDVVNSAWGGADIRDIQSYEHTPSNQGSKYDAGMGLENFVTKYNPDVVFIKHGMNNRGMDSTTYENWYKQMLDDLYKICEESYGKRPKVILLSPTPVSSENPYDDEVTTSPKTAFTDSILNNRNTIAKIAKEYNLTFCDLRTAFMNESIVLGDDYRHTFYSDSSDGTIHPNAAGQYFIFKTLCKTLGVYDETMPIFQLEYEDLNSAPLYVDDTYDVNYDNNYGTEGAGSEMNSDAPEFATLIASVDFDSEGTSGEFAGTNAYDTSTRVDLTDSTICNDALTLEEAKGLEKEFSIVFRAKLDTPYNTNQAVLFLTPGDTAKWTNGVAVGVPGTKNQLWYSVAGSTNVSLPNNEGRITMGDETIAGDGEWHTIAFVGSEDGLTYYVDGEVVYTNPDIKIGSKNIGEYFQNATTLVAHIGSYGTSSGPSYNLKGTMDYYQLYKGALTANEVKALAEQGGTENEGMDDTMPTLSVLDIPSVLASVDFNSKTGVFSGTTKYDTSTQVDLTDSTVCDDPLTLEEAQGLEKEFSIVLRAKLDASSPNTNQAVLFLTPGDAAKWGNGIAVGVPGTSNQLWYYSVAASGEKSNKLDMSGDTIAGDGKWHTIAIVQSKGALTYYVDGVAVYTNDSITVGSTNIGDYFKNATTLVAHIGSYGTGQGTSFNLKGRMDYYQLYGGALTAEQVQKLSPANAATSVDASWSDTVEENNVWMLAGAEQMSGYEGTVVNRSLARLIDNNLRRGSMATPGCQDIRTIDAAAPGYTVEKLNAEYDTIIGENDHDVFLLLPEISQVYAAGYTHSAEEVATYKATVKALLAKESENVRILWTPLASNDATINGYINDYAAAIREIATEEGILLFDANKFMNENMANNESLSRNWFDNDMYVTALCTTDLTRAFMEILCKEITYGVSAGEVTDHNLRYTTDKRIFKGNILRDNIAANSVTVKGEKITVDIEDIKKAYNLDSVTFAVMPAVGTGNYHKDIYYIKDVNVSGDEYTFTAPCSDPIIAIYGVADDGLTYRFKDFKVTVTASQDLTNVAADPDGVYLDGLKVVGAPDLEFDKETLTYDVDLYQYQRKVQILATAQEGLEITVNGTKVESGVNSQLIAVEETATVTVTVKDTVHTGNADVTYTLNLTKPEYPDIIITEVLQDGYAGYTQTGNDNYELIEIYNASGRDLNLLDYSVGYKKGYRLTGNDVEYEFPNYYFTGNNQAIAGRSGTQVTYTGINEITKYSSYWNDGSVTEPEEVNFPADSTMVIWIKFSPAGYTEDQAQTYGKNLTYDTLIQTLKDNKDTYVLSVDGEAVVPSMDQLVVAEIPKGAETGSLTGIATTKLESSVTNFYMDNFRAENANESLHARGYLFVLKDTAEQAENGAITEAGNDIISAARFSRYSGMSNLSMVFSYNTKRGMSLVKDEGTCVVDASGSTSDEQGYGNLTSFGAIEYWQKPADLGDNTNPTVTNNTPKTVEEGTEAAIDLTLKDNEDVRYMELYVRKAGEVEFTKVSEDFVLKAGMENSGVSKDITSKAYTYALGKISGTVEYYGLVIDGNNNETTFGTEASPLTVAIGTGGEENPTTPPAGDEGGTTTGGTTTGGTTTGGTTTGGTTTGGTTTGGTTTSGTTTSGTTTENTTSVQTGDGSLIWLYVALILLTCVGASVVVYKKRKTLLNNK